MQHELRPIRDEIESWKPDVVFNLLEEFHGEAVYDQNVASYLELLRIPYTGCNPRGLMLARGKDLSKKLVHYHRIPMPAFAVFPIGRKVRRPRRLAIPLIVKSLSEDASLGIAQASVVDTDEKLAERVTFIHERIGTAAIAEQYIRRARALCRRARQRPPARAAGLGARIRPARQGAGRSRPRRSSTTPTIQERRGIRMAGRARSRAGARALIQRSAKRIYRTLGLDGYARIDFRLRRTAFPISEANPNPEIAESQEFSAAALHHGLAYRDLAAQRIIGLGTRRAMPAVVRESRKEWLCRLLSSASRVPAARPADTVPLMSLRRASPTWRPRTLPMAVTERFPNRAIGRGILAAALASCSRWLTIAAGVRAGATPRAPAIWEARQGLGDRREIGVRPSRSRVASAKSRSFPAWPGGAIRRSCRHRPALDRTEEPARLAAHPLQHT